MKLHLLVAVILLAKSNISATDICKSGCPTRCKCSERKLRQYDINCTGQNLQQVPDSFPINTTSIDLSRNWITRLPAAGFYGLERLQILRIDYNLLDSLHPDAFQGLPFLQELSLEYNKLTIDYTTFSRNLFRNLTTLKSLKLRGNYIRKESSYIDQAIYKLVSLEHLYLVGSYRFKFGWGYRVLDKLKYVTLSSFGSSIVRAIRGDAFQNIPHVTHLNLSYCNIRAINRGVFKWIPKLKSLDLSFNKELKFKKLTPGLEYIRKAHGLESLNISNIHDQFGVGVRILHSLVWSLFNTSLKEIRLNSNKIESIEPHSLHVLPKTLERAYLTNNRFTYGKYLFEIKYLSNIRLIDISMTSSQRVLPFMSDMLVGDTMTNVYTLPKLLDTILATECYYRYPLPQFNILNASSIRVINATKNLLCPWTGPFRGLENLEILDLSNNQCNNVGNKFFAFLTGLRVLNIQNNLLGISEEATKYKFNTTFVNLTNLELLQLSNNCIDQISNQSFEQLLNVKILDLSNNFMKFFNVKIGHMSNLSKLDLSQNFLETLSEGTYLAIERLSRSHNLTVNISNNEFTCTCAHMDFLLWLKKMRNSKTLELRYIKCFLHNGTVYHLEGERLDRVLEYLDHSCTSLFGIIIVATIIIAILITSLVVILAFRFRWDLRYFYYMVREKYSHTTDDIHEYRYDAFIAYADEDRDFVLNYLIPELEEKDNFKLNDHHRDFPVGKLILENILSAIQMSRKCLVLLSRSFIESGWCMYEFNMAKMECIYAERDMIVVIMLEEIADETLPLQILHQIKTQSYLKFPQEDDWHGKEAFLVNLKTSLRTLR